LFFGTKDSSAGSVENSLLGNAREWDGRTPERVLV
jgi:hypothetical protein